MLRVYIAEDSLELKNIITDVEAAFGSVYLTGSEEEKKLMRLIDQASWHSSAAFIDRFGYKLPILNLSTGCKAALCVLHNIDKIVDLKECGINAKSAILSFCKDGKLLITEPDVKFTDWDVETNICLDNFRFKTIESFNRYLECERFCSTPDMSTGEVEKCLN